MSISHLRVFYYEINRFIDPQNGTVHTQIVASGIRPFFIGIIIIIVGTFPVDLINKIHYLIIIFKYLFRVIFPYTLHTEIHPGMNKDTETVRVVGQGIIRTASNDHTGLPLGKILDHVKLSQENFMI